MDSVPNPDMHQQAGYAPRRQYEQMPPNIAAPVNLANGQGQVGPMPVGSVPTQILQRPPKVKKEKMAELTTATSKLALEESMKMVRT